MKCCSTSKRQLRLIERLAYSVGHFYNDLCASMWFSYLLVFFQYLLGFESDIAGYVLLLGQIVDAISTPFIGIASDKTTRFFCYGKRKGWHLLGTALVSISFPFLFLRCLNCENAWHWYQFIYYGIFVTVFQFGWASVQISHMSIVNSLTTDKSERVELYAWRNAVTLIASMLVYGVAWALLGRDENTKLGPDDVPKFMILMLIVVGVGIFFTVLYHVGVKEEREIRVKRVKGEEAGGNGLEEQEIIGDYKPSVITSDGFMQNGKSSNHDICQYPALTEKEDLDRSLTLLPVDCGEDSPVDKTAADGLTETVGAIAIQPPAIMYWKDWMKEWQFYMVGVQYMMSRLIFGVTQTYWPIFVTETLQLEKKYTAIIPMIICVAGFFASLGMRPINRRLGRKVTMALGLFITGCGLLGVWFLPKHKLSVFAPAVVVGIGTNTLIVSSLSMAADIIGNNVRSSAFVYGAMSLTDKISSGVVIVLIQQFIPACSCDFELSPECCDWRASYFRNVMAFVPITCIVICSIGLLVMIPVKLGHLRKHAVPKADSEDNKSSSNEVKTTTCDSEIGVLISDKQSEVKLSNGDADNCDENCKH